MKIIKEKLLKKNAIKNPLIGKKACIDYREGKNLNNINIKI